LQFADTKRYGETTEEVPANSRWDSKRAEHGFKVEVTVEVKVEAPGFSPARSDGPGNGFSHGGPELKETVSRLRLEFFWWDKADV
jgi:hypothetical protein